jgi:MFS family permease
MLADRWNLLATPGKRRVLFALLYFSEGAPIGYIWWHLPTRLRAADLPIERITGLTAVLVLPWTLKFLWAPLVDTLRSKRWTFRHWIITAQTLMGLALIPLLWLDLHADFALFSTLLLVHAFAAATQDVAIDALAISTTAPGERGGINGWMQAGMLLGRSLFGGVALIVDQWVGPGVVIAALIGTVWASLGLVSIARETPEMLARRSEGFARTLGAVLRERSTWAAIAFALIAGAAFEAVGAVAGPYLIDRGFSQSAVGGFLALPVVVAMVAGALFGGRLSDRLGRVRIVGAALVGIAAATVLLAATHALPGGASLGVLALIYLLIGLFTAASYAMFMDHTRRDLGATQFTSYMAATNACESWAGFTVGRMIGTFGYPPAFLTMAGLSLLALPLLRLLGRTREE